MLSNLETSLLLARENTISTLNILLESKIIVEWENNISECTHLGLSHLLSRARKLIQDFLHAL